MSQSLMNQNLYALFESRFPNDKSRVVIEADGTGLARRIIAFAEFEATIAQYTNFIRTLMLQVIFQPVRQHVRPEQRLMFE